MESAINEQTVQVWDRAHCPSPLPDGYGACGVYIGGSSATHIWDDAELASVAHLPRLPIWVPTPGHENPRQVAMQAVSRLRELGVPSVADDCGRRPAMVWDMETGRDTDGAWLDIAANYLHAHGYLNLVYASLSVITLLPSRAGRWLALPDGLNRLTGLPDELGKQYRWAVPTPGGTIDASVFRLSALGMFWQPS